MPPIQWVKLRQNITPWRGVSKSVSTVAPVVVKPEAASNSASVKLGSMPLSINGIAPNTLSKIHASATTAKPSRARRFRSTGLISRHRGRPMTSGSATLSSIARKSPSP